MNLNRFARAIFRRWYVSVAGILITAGLCLAAYSGVSPTYERSASELLVPGAESVPLGGNPYLYLGGLTQASDVLVSALQSAQVQGPILANRKGTTIAVSRDASTSGPMIIFTVNGSSADNVNAAFHDMLSAVPVTLKTLQDDIKAPTTSRITSQQLTADTKLTVIQKARVEAVGLIGAAGIAVTLLAIALVDGLLLARAERVHRRGGLKHPTETVEVPNIKDRSHPDGDRKVHTIAHK